MYMSMQGGCWMEGVGCNGECACGGRWGGRHHFLNPPSHSHYPRMFQGRRDMKGEIISATH